MTREEKFQRACKNCNLLLMEDWLKECDRAYQPKRYQIVLDEALEQALVTYELKKEECYVPVIEFLLSKGARIDGWNKVHWVVIWDLYQKFLRKAKLNAL